MNRHAKAPSSGSSTRQGSRPGVVVRGAVALALVLAAFLGIGAPAAVTTAAANPGECLNEARRVELHATVLGDCRAWELASPGTSIDITADSGRTVAAATESPGLPMAAKFSSLGGFGDVLGSGVGFDYLSQRDGQAGTSGWAVHAITPPQEPLSFLAAGQGVDPLYELFSPDLSRGVFRSFSSLPGTSANAQQVPNLYLREDVRTPGAGNYQLLSDSASVQAAPANGQGRPWIAGASVDLQHVLFESKLDLTADATGANTKLYKSDDGVVRLVRASGTCAGQATVPPFGSSVIPAANPCSMAGLGATEVPGGPARYTPRVISADGSRVNFTSPFGNGLATVPNTRPGAVSKLYQLDDRGTPATGDDAVLQLSMSENPSPEVAQAAIYQTASTDGSRVFFTSGEQLTETAGSGLYMWQRQPTDETQQLTVDAAAGTFTLIAHSQPSYGAGTLTEGTTKVTAVTGSFTVGQNIVGEGIPAGTTVTEVGTFANASQKFIVLSNAATENGVKSLTAGFQASTDPLPWNATAAEVQSALEELEFIGAGNVTVTGGPGASAPFAIEFRGALSGVDFMPLTTDAGALTGGASTATVATTNDVHNLTLIADGGSGVLGASEDGTRVYFQHGNDIELWTDDGSAAGSLSFVANLPESDLQFSTFFPSLFWNFSNRQLARVSPDGGTLLFEASDGADLPPAYEHGQCPEGNPNGSTTGLCSELYVYRAATSTPSQPDIVCASCDLASPAHSGNTFLDVRTGGGASLTANHLSHALTDDGKRVFFDTPEALVPDDSNSTLDVYEYDVPSGETHLISSGVDAAPSYLMDSSADGSDVLFVTRARLAGWDDDNAYDLYDARAGGGFPDPPAQSAPCQGESCRPAPESPLPGAAVGSGQPGPGNAKGGHRSCPRGRRAVHEKGKVRCVKKNRHHKRNANTNRRAGR